MLNVTTFNWTLFPSTFFLLPIQVLLVTSSRRPDNWIVPGGGVEPNEEPHCTAVREVLEEAGVVGTLGRCLGMFEVSENRIVTKSSFSFHFQSIDIFFNFFVFFSFI